MALAVDAAAVARPITPGAPIVVDLGKKSRKQIRQVHEGTGKLMDEIQSVLEHLRSTGAVAASAHPVVLIVKQKRRKSGLRFPLG